MSLEKWRRRGKAVAGLTEDQAKCLCRCDPFDGDETNGFFVSYFARVRVERVVGNEANNDGSTRFDIPMYHKGLFVAENVNDGKGVGGKKRKAEGGKGGKGQYPGDVTW